MSIMDAVLKRQHGQTIDIYHESMRQTGVRGQQGAESTRKRTAAAMDEHNDDQHDLLLQMIGENRFLKEQLAQRDEELLEQKDLVAFWANGNEAHRRTVAHLQDLWAPLEPASPADLDRKDNLRGLVLEKLEEVVADPNWPNERKAKNEARIAKRKQRVRNG